MASVGSSRLTAQKHQPVSGLGGLRKQTLIHPCQRREANKKMTYTEGGIRSVFPYNSESHGFVTLRTDERDPIFFKVLESLTLLFRSLTASMTKDIIITPPFF